MDSFPKQIKNQSQIQFKNLNWSIIALELTTFNDLLLLVAIVVGGECGIDAGPVQLHRCQDKEDDVAQNDNSDRTVKVGHLSLVICEAKETFDQSGPFPPPPCPTRPRPVFTHPWTSNAPLRNWVWWCCPADWGSNRESDRRSRWAWAHPTRKSSTWGSAFPAGGDARSGGNFSPSTR